MGERGRAADRATETTKRPTNTALNAVQTTKQKQDKDVACTRHCPPPYRLLTNKTTLNAAEKVKVSSSPIQNEEKIKPNDIETKTDEQLVLLRKEINKFDSTHKKTLEHMFTLSLPFRQKASQSGTPRRKITSRSKPRLGSQESRNLPMIQFPGGGPIRVERFWNVEELRNVHFQTHWWSVLSEQWKTLMPHTGQDWAAIISNKLALKWTKVRGAEDDAFSPNTMRMNADAVAE
ncbi:hypothetical protein ROHU_001419 [Labeo rohita]|uniref:Uncharacterized protein n=1 Tax=Labeo rohita TaxID=84645 RepID=A0A498MKI6_LABRO|nr:hypothetical protein ROHU_026767 [Labeo rohita]RXN38121.1 hypothetical protein ROHU_001419 [Labeo rohita]